MDNETKTIAQVSDQHRVRELETELLKVRRLPVVGGVAGPINAHRELPKHISSLRQGVLRTSTKILRLADA